MAQLQFNAHQVPPASAATPQLPVSDKAGWPMVITASEIKENKSKDGGYLELTLTIIDGSHKGQEGIDRLNIFNKSEKATSIAYGQLSAYCHVTNVYEVADSQQLHNIPFRGVVGMSAKKADWKEGDAEYTEIKGVLHMDGSAPGKSTGAPSAAAPTPVPMPTPTPEPEKPAWQQGVTADTKPAWQQGGAATGGKPPWQQ